MTGEKPEERPESQHGGPGRSGQLGLASRLGAGGGGGGESPSPQTPQPAPRFHLALSTPTRPRSLFPQTLPPHPPLRCSGYRSFAASVRFTLQHPPRFEAEADAAARPGGAHPKEARLVSQPRSHRRKSPD